MKIIKLSDYIYEINDRTTENNQYPVLTSSQDGIVSQSEYFNKKVASKDTTGYKIVRNGQFTYRSMSDTGRFYINRQECCPAGIVSPAYPVFALKDNNDLLAEYLQMFFQTDYFQSLIANQSAGSTRVSLKLNRIKDITLCVPAIEEQFEIIHRLDRVKRIIDLRTKQLETLDTLVKSRFIEMFGDPISNPMGWNIVTIGEVISSSEAGWSGNGIQQKKKPGEIAVLKVSAVTKGYFIPEECKVLDDQNNIKKYIYPQKGDLLFSRANTREMVGATAIIQEDYPEYILPDKLWRIRFTANSNVYYMKYILSSKSIRNRFSAESTGTSGSMYNVSMEKFRAMQIPLPPTALQSQFSAFVQEVDKSKSAIQKSLDALKTLQKALMQKYFS